MLGKYKQEVYSLLKTHTVKKYSYTGFGEVRTSVQNFIIVNFKGEKR